MFMIVMSSTIMSWASPISARISQRRRSGGAGGLAGAAPPGTLVAAMIFSHLEVCSPLLADDSRSGGYVSTLGYDDDVSTVTRPPRRGRQLTRQRRARPAGGGPARPLRKDAERNRQRILQAAAEVFTERGLEATLDDVAHHAGVGVGTVYRRFPDKASLADALFEQRIDAARWRWPSSAYGEPDAWQALVSFMERSAEMLASDRGLRQMLMFAAVRATTASPTPGTGCGPRSTAWWSGPRPRGRYGTTWPRPTFR